MLDGWKMLEIMVAFVTGCANIVLLGENEAMDNFRQSMSQGNDDANFHMPSRQSNSSQRSSVRYYVQGGWDLHKSRTNLVGTLSSGTSLSPPWHNEADNAHPKLFGTYGLVDVAPKSGKDRAVRERHPLAHLTRRSIMVPAMMKAPSTSIWQTLDDISHCLGWQAMVSGRYHGGSSHDLAKGRVDDRIILNASRKSGVALPKGYTQGSPSIRPA